MKNKKRIKKLEKKILEFEKTVSKSSIVLVNPEDSTSRVVLGIEGNTFITKAFTVNDNVITNELPITNQKIKE